MLAEADALPTPTLMNDGLPPGTDTMTNTAQREPTATPTLEGMEMTVTPTAEQSTPSPTATIEGPATRTPTPTPEEPQMIAWGFGQIPGVVHYAFIVKNPNSGQLFQDVGYRMAAYDSNGIVLSTNSGTIAEIGAGQELGIVASITLNAELSVAQIEVELFGGQAVGATAEETPLSEALTFVEPALVPGNQPSLTGTVRNALDREVVGVTIYGIAYNEAEQIIGGGFGSVPFIAANGQAPVSLPVVTSGEVTHANFWAVSNVGQGRP